MIATVFQKKRTLLNRFENPNKLSWQLPETGIFGGFAGSQGFQGCLCCACHGAICLQTSSKARARRLRKGDRASPFSQTEIFIYCPTRLPTAPPGSQHRIPAVQKAALVSALACLLQPGLLQTSASSSSSSSVGARAFLAFPLERLPGGSGSGWAAASRLGGAPGGSGLFYFSVHGMRPGFGLQADTYFRLPPPEAGSLRSTDVGKGRSSRIISHLLRKAALHPTHAGCLQALHMFA